MAIAVKTVWECNAGATAGNVNGGGFNPSNANMAGDLACDAGTGNTAAPVVSSGSYNFAGDDVGAWLYVQAGTGWTPGWYQIASVAANKATLSAAVGAAVQVDATGGSPNPWFLANAAAGCATTGSPTGGTWSIDYSQGTAARNTTTTDLASTSGTTAPSVVTSASFSFGVNCVGNIIHVTAGTSWLAGWYEVVSVSGGAATLDRACGSAATLSSGTWRLGGAISLGSALDDAFFEQGSGTNAVGASRFFVRSGNYSLGQTVSIASSGGTQAPIVVEGYNSLRGDRPCGDTRPSIAAGIYTIVFGANWDVYYLAFSGTNTSVVSSGANGKYVCCRFVNPSGAANRAAFTASTDCLCLGCEAISYRGRAVAIGNSSGPCFFGCWCHDSDIGILASNAQPGVSIAGCLLTGHVSAAVSITAAYSQAILMEGNTLYGAANRMGIGISVVSGVTDLRVLNSVVYGFATGIQHADAQWAGFGNWNDFYNNGADVANWQKGAADLAVDPGFVAVGQVTGTGGAFTAANDRLVDGSKDFGALGVVAGRDYLYIVSGTGVAAGIYGIASIATTGSANDTLVLDLAPGTDTTADKQYQITVGQNFGVGTALKATGFPGLFPGGVTTGYLDIGAVQRQEPAGGGGSGYSRGRVVNG